MPSGSTSPLLSVIEMDKSCCCIEALKLALRQFEPGEKSSLNALPIRFVPVVPPYATNGILMS